MITTRRKLDLRICPGAEEPLTGNYFVSTYPPFSCWKSHEVGEVQRVLKTRGRLGSNVPLGLYVHIPFCAKRCDYCYYLSYAGMSREVVDRYLDALLGEIAIYGRSPLLAGRQVAFAYVGGGTPSLLSVSQIRRLLHGIEAIFPMTSAREITFECAPKTVTESKLRALRDCGVSRVSLGVQQFSDDVLKKNGRIHLIDDVARAYAAIRRVGFDVVNLDLMVGMLGETDDSFRDSLENIVKMQPDSITIYQMEVPPNTPLYRAMRDQTLDTTPATWDVKRARLANGFARLEEVGYTPRSAYSAVRDPKRHRFVYQDSQYRGADLVGVGLSSFSYLAGLHYQNLASLEAYFASLNDGGLPLDRAYALDDEEQMVREFVLQLKLGSVCAQYFRDKFNVEISRRFAEPLSRFADEGWLTVDADCVALTREGLLRVDRVLPAFYLPRHANERYW